MRLFRIKRNCKADVYVLSEHSSLTSRWKNVAAFSTKAQCEAVQYLLETLDVIEENVSTGGSPNYTMERSAQRIAKTLKDLRDRMKD